MDGRLGWSTAIRESGGSRESSWKVHEGEEDSYHDLYDRKQRSIALPPLDEPARR